MELLKKLNANVTGWTVCSSLEYFFSPSQLLRAKVYNFFRKKLLLHSIVLSIWTAQFFYFILNYTDVETHVPPNKHRVHFYHLRLNR